MQLLFDGRRALDNTGLLVRRRTFDYSGLLVWSGAFNHSGLLVRRRTLDNTGLIFDDDRRRCCRCRFGNRFRSFLASGQAKYEPDQHTCLNYVTHGASPFF